MTLFSYLSLLMALSFYVRHVALGRDACIQLLLKLRNGPIRQPAELGFSRFLAHERNASTAQGPPVTAAINSALLA